MECHSGAESGRSRGEEPGTPWMAAPKHLARILFRLRRRGRTSVLTFHGVPGLRLTAGPGMTFHRIVPRTRRALKKKLRDLWNPHRIIILTSKLFYENLKNARSGRHSRLLCDVVGVHHA